MAPGPKPSRPRPPTSSSAACGAAGQGKVDPPPDDAARAKLRVQFLGWLRDELDAWSKASVYAHEESRADVGSILRNWRQDPDLVGVRDTVVLAKFTEAQGAAWQAPWSDGDRLLEGAGEAR